MVGRGKTSNQFLISLNLSRANARRQVLGIKDLVIGGIKLWLHSTEKRQ